MPLLQAKASMPMTTAKKKSPDDLRSYRWLGRNDLRSFGHRSRLRQFGYDRDDWVGKPVIGIINTWSDINACHGHLRARAEDVKRGVYACLSSIGAVPACRHSASTSLSRQYLKLSLLTCICS